MKTLNGTYKIALVGDMLSEGGAERVQARLSFYFKAIGIEVHHIIVQDKVTYRYAGHLFNLGKLKNKENSVFNKWSRLLKFRSYLKQHQFDFIIDFRVKNNFNQEYIIANYIYKSPFIMSIRSFNTNYYFPKNKSFARRIFKNAYGFTAVSQRLAQKIKSEYHYNNVATIYNPLDFDLIDDLSVAPITLKEPYILAVGRLHQIKQFDHLIEAYAKSQAKANGVKLVIIGEGEELENLKALAQSLNTGDQVTFLAFKKNIYPYYKKALFTVLTSKNEGFPNVLIESLACKTPVVSYDCESGPSEIINHKRNGLLVEDKSINGLVKAFNTMITKNDVYHNCKVNSFKSVKHLGVDEIGRQWVDFMNIN